MLRPARSTSTQRLNESPRPKAGKSHLRATLVEELHVASMKVPPPEGGEMLFTLSRPTRITRLNESPHPKAGKFSTSCAQRPASTTPQ